MIVYNPASGKFYVRGGGREFEPGTQSLAVQFADFLVTTRLNSPQELIASRSSAAQDLCHHVSHGDIERMVAAYLNGDITLNQFMILVGSVLRPSWSNLFFPPTLLSLLASWTISLGQRIDLLGSQAMGNPVAAASAANRLVHTLNSAISNLRYSHRSSNRSIQGHFDLRLHRGFSVDPIQLAVLFYAWTRDRPLLAGESSAMLNDFEAYARDGIPLIGTSIKMSESDERVASTQRSNNPVMGSSTIPVRDQYFRGSFSFWTPVSVDTLLLMIGCWMVAYALGLIKYPF